MTAAGTNNDSSGGQALASARSDLHGLAIRHLDADTGEWCQPNLPERLTRAMAHTLYFHFEKDDSAGSIARLTRDALALTKYHDDVVAIANGAPEPDPGTVGPKVSQPH